jgi:hypothetical protein
MRATWPALALVPCLMGCRGSGTVEVQYQDWLITVNPAGGAEDWAHERFEPHMIDAFVRQGTKVERVIPGTRYTMKVALNKRGAGTEPGTYQLYGLVTQIDPVEKTMTLSNAVFAPVPADLNPHLRPNAPYCWSVR